MNNYKSVDSWIKKQKSKLVFSVKKKNLINLNKWIVTKKTISHESKKFFNVVGVRVKTNFHKKKTWDQPLFFQNEIGILGILRREYKGKKQYLIQAKMEPGSLNRLQLSPTVQATKSNYTRVHSGKKVTYLNFFKNINRRNIVVNSPQSEHGDRCLFKYNNNMIIDVNKNIKIKKNFIWLNKSQLNQLINKNNKLNMNSISVLSCSIKNNNFDFPLHSLGYIEKWFRNLKKKYYINRKVIPLNNIKKWKFDKKSIFHKSEKYFSVIGVKVLTNSREISSWEQPIIQANWLGLSGFITKKINLTDHYLVRFSVKSGLRQPGLSCTVHTSSIKTFSTNKNYSPQMKKYFKKCFIDGSHGKVLYNKIQSDEGGRFYHSQTKNIIVKIDDDEKIKIDSNYMWMSHNQVLHFIKKGIFNIEARILFACININNIL